MKVFYSPYKLTPLKRANRLSSMDAKPGVLLKGVLGDKITFADYFPHLPLGDRTCDQFLSEFKYQDVDYDKKVFHLLLKDSEYQKTKPKLFQNHQLWTGSEPIEAKVIKYKMLHLHDRSMTIPLENGLRLRLDGNALFSRAQYLEFMKDIPEKFHAQFDYIEDPLSDKDWSGLKVPSAMDFISGSPFDYYIYKPNCEFAPKTETKIIYSAYLGHTLGNWHTYCELIHHGDLTLTHGIIGRGFYQEEKEFLNGNYQAGFIADTSQVNKVYQDVYQSEWKLLCSI